MSLTIEKLNGSYVVSWPTKRSVESAEHVANFIIRYWPDVAEHLRSKLKNLPAAEPRSDRIENS